MKNRKILAVFILIGTGLLGLVLMQGKKFGTNHILPSTVTVSESAEDEDQEEQDQQGQKEKAQDYSLYAPKMLTGKWILQDMEGADTVEIPSAKESGSMLEALSMPEQIIFADDVFTSIESEDRKSTSMYVQSDCFDMRAIYRLKDSKDRGRKDPGSIEETSAESSTYNNNKGPGQATLDLAGIFDIKGSRLALGLIGLDPEEKPGPDSKEMAVTEIQYDIDWQGDRLILSYNGSKASYKPSRWQEDPLFLSDGYLSLGQPANPSMDFHAIRFVDDSRGQVYNVYGHNIPMTYRFDKDGSFHVELDQGTKWDYKGYLLSDNGLVLRKDNQNLTYVSSMYFMDHSFSRSILQIENNSPVFEFNNARKESPLGSKLSKLIKQGYILYADPDSLMGPGKVSQVFTLDYNGIPMEAKVCNVTDQALPMASCYLCWFHCSMEEEGIKIVDTYNHYYGNGHVMELTNRDTMADLEKRYDNLIRIGADCLSSSSGFYNTIDENELTSYGAQVILPKADCQITILNFTDDHLSDCTVLVPAYYFRNMHYSTDPETLCKADAGKAASIRAAGSALDNNSSALIDALTGQMGDRLSLQEPDENGYLTGTEWQVYDAEVYTPAATIQIPWTKLFEYGKEDLSKEGEVLLDQILSGLENYVKNPDISRSISTIGICSYTPLLDQKTASRLSQGRADAICQYAWKKYGKEERSLGSLLKPAGYGVTDYLSVSDHENQMGPFIEIHCYYNPESDLLAGQDMEEAVTSITESGDHLYMDPEQEGFSQNARDIADYYKGVYRDHSYSIKNLDLSWDLPEGWHFANDQELAHLNGGSAPDLLNSGNSIYVMAAYSKDYSSMAHIRMYPGQILTGYSENEEKSIVQTMHKSILTDLDEYAKDITDSLEIDTKNGEEEYRSEFTYTDGDRVYHRKISYIIKEDLLVLTSEIMKE